MYVGNHALCGSQMERRACTLLRCMENPAKKHKCIKELYGLGEDVVVRLSAACSFSLISLYLISTA